MKKADKAPAIAALKESFQGANAVFLTEYRGLTVTQMTDLRRKLAGNAKYAVAKNTLTLIAAKEVGYDFLEEELVGPTAAVFVTGDPVDAAKVIRDFAKGNDALIVKGGVMEGKYVSSAEVSKLADLDSREVLLAKAAGVLKATMYQAAYVFTAPATKAVRTIDALREKQAQEG